MFFKGRREKEREGEREALASPLQESSKQTTLVIYNILEKTLVL
jgi:hypothetical protein